MNAAASFISDIPLETSTCEHNSDRPPACERLRAVFMSGFLTIHFFIKNITPKLYINY